MAAIITQMRKELKAMADPTIQASGKRYFKEETKTYGTKTPAVRAMAKKAFKEIKDESKDAVFGYCETLWKSGYMEEGFIACEWSYGMRKQYEPADLDTFERWISLYVTNWATCDTLCNHTVGDLLQMYPDEAKRLTKWAVSDNRWMRRAAAVSLVVPAKKGKFKDLIFRIAKLLLKDKDDLVQKGYGWLLKECSEFEPKPVYEFVMEHKADMPRTALRYAVEKMPDDWKQEAMKK
ncbi:DNA alkylation repair protein [Chitinophaga lutea]